MSAPEIPFSELVQKPTDTVARLKATRGQTLRLRRRDAEDLTLTTASRAEQEHAVVSATTRMFVALVRHDEAARSLLVDVVPEAFPWVRFLPIPDIRAFALVRTMGFLPDIRHTLKPCQGVVRWAGGDVHREP